MLFNTILVLFNNLKKVICPFLFFFLLIYGHSAKKETIKQHPFYIICKLLLFEQQYYKVLCVYLVII